MEVFIIAALTADGFIARSEQQLSTDWTSKEDAQFFRDRTRQAGAIVMGRKTFETIGQPLPNRLNIVYSNDPSKFSQFDPQQLMVTQLNPTDLINQLIQAGYQSLAVCGGTSIYTMFMNSGLVNRMFLTTEPVLFGTGVSLFNQQINQKIKLVQQHQLSDQTKVSEYLVLPVGS